jgi:hypothetical protein
MTNEEAKRNLVYAKRWGDKPDDEALEIAIKALEQTRWIPVGERLPMCEQEVLICAERRSINGKIKTIITTAIYEDGTMLENKSKWDWTDIDWERWDEEEDCGVIPEGWWEYRHYNSEEVYNNLVDDFAVKWMPLPELPEPYKAESEE